MDVGGGCKSPSGKVACICLRRRRNDWCAAAGTHGRAEMGLSSSPRQLGNAERAAFARKLSVPAGAFCLSERAALSAADIDAKGEAETLIRTAIERQFPGEAVVGEECNGTA